VNEGQVQFGYWHVAFLGPESAWAAEASECAADQDAFWEYHDLIFESQAGENQDAFSKDALKQFAVDLGLDSQAFDECLDSGKYVETVQNDTEIARQIGATSTPAFIINGQALVGAQPFDVFQQIIDGILTE
jgi:protein-disulfide isomerase